MGGSPTPVADIHTTCTLPCAYGIGYEPKEKKKKKKEKKKKRVKRKKENSASQNDCDL
jgi:hypothetical protein